MHRLNVALVNELERQFQCRRHVTLGLFINPKIVYCQQVEIITCSNIQTLLSGCKTNLFFALCESFHLNKQNNVPGVRFFKINFLMTTKKLEIIFGFQNVLQYMK